MHVGYTEPTFDRVVYSKARDDVWRTQLSIVQDELDNFRCLSGGRELRVNLS